MYRYYDPTERLYNRRRYQPRMGLISSALFAGTAYAADKAQDRQDERRFQRELQLQQHEAQPQPQQQIQSPLLAQHHREYLSPEDFQLSQGSPPRHQHQQRGRSTSRQGEQQRQQYQPQTSASISQDRDSRLFAAPPPAYGEYVHQIWCTGECGGRCNGVASASTTHESASQQQTREKPDGAQGAGLGKEEQHSPGC